MGQQTGDDRISQITTMWSLLAKAHAGQRDAAAAQRELMDRYHRAVHRYLLGALRDEDAAEELFQEFALRFVRGDFRRADRGRGRFRDYVKKALINLVNQHHRKRKAGPRTLPDNLAATGGGAEAQSEASFEQSWAMELLEQTWAELEKAQPVYCAVLRFHVKNPDAHSPEIAAEVGARIGKALTATHARVTLHRARQKFAELLLEEVRRSLESPTEAELLEELKILQLLKACQPALERQKRDE